MYDLAVIGAGPGGYVTAIRAAQLGMRVALIEKQHVGGTCLNRGCIPTKALLHAGEVFASMKTDSLNKLGMTCENPAYSVDGVSQYRDAAVKKLRVGTEQLLKSHGVTLIKGFGSFVDKHKIKVAAADASEQVIEAKNIIIAVGSVVSNPKIPGFELAKDSDNILEEIFDIPNDVVVAGGSVIGVEFAEIFNSFGKNTTLLATRDRVLPKNDKDCGVLLGQVLKRKGINVRFFARMKAIEKLDDGKLKVSFSLPEGEDSIITDMVVACVGRKPYLAGLCPEKAGIVINDDGSVKVDKNLKTTTSNIYAIGDCINGGLAHVASAQGINVVEVLAGHKAGVNLDVIPTCIYSTPEVATVGLTERECEEKGIEIEIGKFPMAANGKSIIVGQDRGFVKTVFEKKTGKIVGAHMVCDRATDIVAELGLAIANGMKREGVLKFMHPHPTIVEAVAESVEDSLSMAIHVGKKRQ